MLPPRPTADSVRWFPHLKLYPHHPIPTSPSARSMVHQRPISASRPAASSPCQTLASVPTKTL